MTASAPRPEIMALLQEAAAVERDAAAKIADAVAVRLRTFRGNRQEVLIAEQIAAQIRARGARMKEHGP